MLPAGFRIAGSKITTVRFVLLWKTGIFVKRISVYSIKRGALDTVTNEVASLRKERRIYPAGHSILQTRCRINAAFPSLCPVAPQPNRLDNAEIQINLLTDL
jgi:hypothetical protein